MRRAAITITLVLLVSSGCRDSDGDTGAAAPDVTPQTTAAPATTSTTTTAPEPEHPDVAWFEEVSPLLAAWAELGFAQQEIAIEAQRTGDISGSFGVVCDSYQDLHVALTELRAFESPTDPSLQLAWDHALRSQDAVTSNVIGSCAAMDRDDMVGAQLMMDLQPELTQRAEEAWEQLLDEIDSALGMYFDFD